MPDFGYNWIWTHGHLVPAILFAVVALLALRFRWPRWIRLAAILGATWALFAFWIVQEKLGLNRAMPMPPVPFMATGAGNVIDLGAGSGRTAAMVLQARPGARLTALDKFSGSFGIDDNTPERFHRNMAALGVGGRAQALTADMTSIPLPDGSFDAAVSGYAIDHLNRENFTKAIAETRRVLRPGGEFLFFTINRDSWLRFSYPFLHGHGYYGRESLQEYWKSRIREGGFEIAAEGVQPGSYYILARKAG